MTDPQVALGMLGILILTIFLGFPVAFTLMALGVGFGYYAYYDPTRMATLFDNRIFDLLVNQTYSVISNDVLTAIPLFLFMGYIVERANIVDRLFTTLYIAMRRIPGSLAVATLITCTLFATATGIVGAVVTLLGLLALPPMLKARYSTSYATGVIAAGGTLGILIPPSIMLIVYAATSGVSVVRMYAGALFPGLLLAGLYLVYIVVLAILRPNVAPKPKNEDIGEHTVMQVVGMLLTSFFPLAVLILSVLGAILFGFATPSEAAAVGALGGLILAVAYRTAAVVEGREKPEWALDDLRGQADRLFYSLGIGAIVAAVAAGGWLILRLLWRWAINSFAGSEEGRVAAIAAIPAEPGFLLQPGFITILGVVVTALVFVLGRPMARRAASQRIVAFVGQGALGGLTIAAVYMLAINYLGLDSLLRNESNSFFQLDTGFLLGAALWMAYRVMDQKRLSEAVYLTVRTSAMVCWLFVGSATFASVFSYLGGQQVITDFVTGLDISPLAFLIIAQLIIFILGWPLEWTEIIVIFIPIFLPLLAHFDIDPLFFGILVAINLQTAFLSPPMAMSAYYLKGIAPPEVRLTQIFAGMLPYMFIVIFCMVIIYIFPGIATWLPSVTYGR